MKYLRGMSYANAVIVKGFVNDLKTESWAREVPFGMEIYADTDKDWLLIEEFIESMGVIHFIEDTVPHVTVANIVKDFRETGLIKPELIVNNFYWVKLFKDSVFEPARCKKDGRSGRLYFSFTDGGTKQCENCVDYKPLNYNE